jgi:hypothetical protein
VSRLKVRFVQFIFPSELLIAVSVKCVCLLLKGCSYANLTSFLVSLSALKFFNLF